MAARTLIVRIRLGIPVPVTRDGLEARIQLSPFVLAIKNSRSAAVSEGQRPRGQALHSDNIPSFGYGAKLATQQATAQLGQSESALTLSFDSPRRY
jgi:hypothetical protein